MGHVPTFALECTGCDVVTEVRFNDWPAFRFSKPTGQTTVTILLNAMLVEGPNVLRVLMQKKNTLPAHDRRVEVRLFRMLGEEDQQELLYFRHHPQLHGIADDGWTEVYRHEVEFGVTFGRWKWEDARPFVDADRPGVVAAIREVHAAMSRHDVPGFVDLHALKLEELARSQQRPVEEKVKEQNDLLTLMMGDDDAIVAPIDYDKLEFESWCQGRLVRVTEAGKRPFRVDCGQQLEFDAVLTRVGDAWRVAR